MAKQRTVLIVADDISALDIDHPITAEVLAQFRIMNSVVALDRFDFRLQEPSSPPTYDYEIEATDGRTWSQIVTFDVPSDPMQTFDVPPPGWRLSEFTTQRRVRDLMVTAASTLGLRRFRIRWETV